MKPWYKSRTLWANVIAVVAIIFAGLELTQEETAAILGVINVLLRLITREKLSW